MPDREVVAGAPPGVDQTQLFRPQEGPAGGGGVNPAARSLGAPRSRATRWRSGGVAGVRCPGLWCTGRAAAAPPTYQCRDGVLYRLPAAVLPGAEQRWRVGVPFFLWIGIFSLMVIAQFWAYANDIYTPDEGKRLFALIAFGASSGAVFGAFISGKLIGVLGVHAMLLVAAVILAASLIVFNIIDIREDAGGRAARRQAVEAPIGNGSAFGLVMRNRYLLLIAVLVLLLNWVNATGEYILSSIVRRAADSEIAAGTAITGAGGRLHRRVLLAVFPDREHRRHGAATVRRIESRQVPWRPRGGVRPAGGCAGKLRDRGAAAVAGCHAMGQDGGKLGRLFAAEHRQSDALSADDTRGEVQGEAGNGQFRRPLRRCAVFGNGFHRDVVLALGTSQFAWINVVLVTVWLALAVATGLEFRRRVPVQEARST